MAQFHTYYDYEFTLARYILVPLFKKMRIYLNEKKVLDVGCGEGGILSGLGAHFRFEGLGIDYDADMISKCKASPNTKFECADFLSYEFEDRFDFILLRDVLEHSLRPSKMLACTASLLSPTGLAYVTYTPYLSPFGGHQHNGNGIFSNVPYIHLLPESLFLRLIRPTHSIYKTTEYLLEDLKRIRKTAIKTAMVKEACREYDLKILLQRMYFIRPDYRFKFGLPKISMPSFFPLGTALDPFCTSVELLLQKE